jgi:regulatory protein
MKITGILRDKRVKGRFHLHFGELGSMPVSDETIAEHGLVVGLDLDRPRLDAILKEDEKKRALSASFNLLSFSQRSRKELAERLKRKFFSPEAVNHALDKLTSLGYLNDPAFAKSLLSMRRSQKKGTELIKFEMKRKGIAPGTINDVFSENPLTVEQEAEQLLPLASKKLAQARGIDKKTAARKLMGFLARRGFSLETSRQVLKMLKKDPGDEL